MLPEHAGGTFEAVTMGDRTLARMLSDPKSPYKDEGDISYWASAGRLGLVEEHRRHGRLRDRRLGRHRRAPSIDTKLGKFGASLSYLWGKDDDKGERQ